MLTLDLCPLNLENCAHTSPVSMASDEPPRENKKRTSGNCNERRERIRRRRTLGTGHFTEQGRLSDRGKADQDGAPEACFGDVEAGAGFRRAAGGAFEEFGAVAGEFGFQETEVVFRRLGVRKRGHREDISTVSAGLTVSRCERV